MTIKIYRNWMHVWEPIREDWKKHRAILFPLCTCGSIGFKRKEDIIAFFAEHGITAEEDIGLKVDTDIHGQLLMF